MESIIQNQLSFNEKIHYAITRSKGIPVETDLGSYNKIYDKIKEYSYKNKSDTHLRQAANTIKQWLLHGEKSDHLIPQLFALINEVMTRTLGITPYPVQIIGGIALSQGKLIQMQTGEG
ncbi:MAG: hypothetical protein OQK82_05355, partial [Candidatus Pacearchaeota archaeon]|nr:hypothetical protein [Candidatus Pacearchaeota archaeon]